MTIRDRIARWISPDLGNLADRYWHLASDIDLCARWLAEFDDVSKVLLHLQESDRDRWRPLGAPTTRTMPYEIGQFRELLRRGSST